MKRFLIVLTFLVMYFQLSFAPVSNFTAQVKEIEKDAKIFGLDVKKVTALFLSEDMQLRNITRRVPRLDTWAYGAGRYFLRLRGIWDTQERGQGLKITKSILFTLLSFCRLC